MNRGMMALGALIFAVGLTYAAWFASYLPQAPARQEGSSAELEGVARIGVWGEQVGARFGGGILFMIVGGLVARRAKKAGGAEEEDQEGTEDGPFRSGSLTPPPKRWTTMLGDFEAKLQRLVDLSMEAVDEGGTLPAEARAIADELDGFLNDEVPAFIELRTQMIDTLGLERFAEMIGYFSSMERGAARAWSAITDEVWSEAKPSLARALRSVKRARSAYGSSASSEG